ncbi:hypothetical protein ACTMU2_41770 [Cupriavidus basilensis]
MRVPGRPYVGKFRAVMFQHRVRLALYDFLFRQIRTVSRLPLH